MICQLASSISLLPRSTADRRERFADLSQSLVFEVRASPRTSPRPYKVYREDLDKFHRWFSSVVQV